MLVVALVCGLTGVASARAGVPVVFIPGHNVKGSKYDAKALGKQFAKAGYTLTILENETGGTIADRGEDLARDLQQGVLETLKSGQKIHLVAHSLGGLQARRMLHDYPNLAKRVASLTTIATPHRGANLINVVNPGKSTENLLEMFGGDTQAYEDMKPKQMKQFNAEVLDAPGVRYFSLAFALPQPYELYTPELALVTAARMLQAAGHGRNDGLVTEESQLWGKRINVTYRKDGETRVINTCDHRTQTRKSVGSGVKILGLKLPGVPSRNECNSERVFSAIIGNLQQL